MQILLWMHEVGISLPTSSDPFSLESERRGESANMSLALEKGLGMGSPNFTIYVKLYQKRKNSCPGSNGGSISTFPISSSVLWESEGPGAGC